MAFGIGLQLLPASDNLNSSTVLEAVLAHFRMASLTVKFDCFNLQTLLEDSLVSQFNMATVTHHRFTVDEYERMIDNGILTENERVELIRGEVVEKMVVGPLHSATVNRINRLLTTRLLALAIVSVQNPIVLNDSEPEPDLALLAPREDFYATSKPKSSDACLVIEVADTSIAYDRDIKLPLYAQAGIQEFWIVNLVELMVEVYRQPLPSGSYALRTDFVRGDMLSALAFSEVTLAIDSMLG